MNFLDTLRTVQDICSKKLQRLDTQYGSDLVCLTLTFHDWFQQTRMRPCDWSVCSPQSPNTAENTLSSVKLCLLLSEVQCCHTLHETLFNNVMKKYASCSFLGYFIFSLLTFCKFNESKRCFILKTGSNILDGCVSLSE